MQVYVLLVNAVILLSIKSGRLVLQMYRKHSHNSNNMKVYNTNANLTFTYCAREGTDKTWSYPLTVPASYISTIKKKNKKRGSNIIT